MGLRGLKEAKNRAKGIKGAQKLSLKFLKF
jgi:hypothetical protein